MSRPDLPEAILQAFEGVPHLSMPALAKAAKMDPKTLAKHREAGNLPVHIKGTGLERRHYVCTLNDVAEFYRRTGEECQSSRSETRPITSSISRSKAIDFTARQKPRTNVMLRKSRKRSALNPSGSSKNPSERDVNP